MNTFCGTHPEEDERTLVVLKFEISPENRIMFNESLTVRANYEEIRQPCERLRHNLRQAGVSEEIAGQCELALQELLTNLVDHAYEGNPNGQIAVRMAGNRGQIFIQTEDTGLPAKIKMEDVHMPDPEDLAEGGYGMAIIRSLMDDVRYETAQGKNVWIMVKNL